LLLWPRSAISCPPPQRLIRGLDSLGSGLDELHHVIGVGDHRRGSTGSRRWWRHASGELALGIGRDGLIAVGDHDQHGCDFRT
jgi:hypothetical protein